MQVTVRAAGGLLLFLPGWRRAVPVHGILYRPAHAAAVTQQVCAVLHARLLLRHERVCLAQGLAQPDGTHAAAGTAAVQRRWVVWVGGSRSSPWAPAVQACQQSPYTLAAGRVAVSPRTADWPIGGAACTGLCNAALTDTAMPQCFFLCCCRVCRQHCADAVCSPHHAQLRAVAAVLGDASGGAAVLSDQLLPRGHQQREVHAVHVWVRSQQLLQQLHSSHVWKVGCMCAAVAWMCDQPA